MCAPPQVMDPMPERGQASYGMRHMTHGARRAIAGIVDALLAAGADPNAVDKEGKTPLHYAAVGGLGTMVEALVSGLFLGHGTYTHALCRCCQCFAIVALSVPVASLSQIFDFRPPSLRTSHLISF